MAERFAFGENWESFARLVDDERVRIAEDELARMLSSRDLAGRSFLDVGCGSGLHALAAHRLGAAPIVAVDLDPASVATARALLARFGADGAATRVADVLDLPADLGEFDIVYSWGVLHHTGDMRRAVVNAALRTRPGGLFAVGLYGRTLFCPAWRRIKRWYVGATPRQRAQAERLYVRYAGLALALRGRRLSDHIARYRSRRGMDFHHDVRDWIGGYPYESIRPPELQALLAPMGFELVGQNVKRRTGLTGSGIDEFLFCRLPSPTRR
jgi:2-polyprenyl-6-hydroxyphenyl methylase/3-demethylubiquinone-9 3-methyltransferase